jgi:2-desacetyl-2-hydroxyethyl bacteriochlorophyllide A dehydrogenase
MKIQQVIVTGQNEVELQENELGTGDLGPAEIVVETEFTYISAGTELANYTAKDPNVFVKDTWCAYPWNSGYANVGRVTAVGSNVTRTTVGERVFSYGPHSSAHRYNSERLVVPVPDDIEPAIAAASRMAAVALTAPILSRIQDNPWVVMFGLGMVGNLAAQAYTIMGCRVIGVDPVAERRAVAEQCGVLHTVGGDQEEVRARIKSITDGEMGNITVDAVGHSAVCVEALRATATFGQMLILGTPRVPVEGDLTEIFNDAHGRWITIQGAIEWCLPMYPTTRNAESQFSKQQTVFDWIRRGEMKFEPLISHRMKPEQIKEAYEGLLNHPDTYTGVLLDWTDSHTER